MFSRIRRHFTYTNVALTLALVFTMSGGAYAASRYVITSTRQISPKVLKSLQGKTGANGAQGPAGPVGPAGSQGAAGPAGSQGKEGPQGKQGEPGTNGTTGFTETLPSGKTLEGDWDMTGVMPGTGSTEGLLTTSVRFGIPLAEAPIPVYVKSPTPEEEANHEFPTDPEGCTGNVEEPGAEKGHLCVFARSEFNIASEGVHVCSSGGHPVFLCALGSTGVPGHSDRFGFVVGALDRAAGLIFVNGTWAVTAE